MPSRFFRFCFSLYLPLFFWVISGDVFLRGESVGAHTNEASVPTIFGNLRLVQEIDCGKQNPDAEFPENCSKTETILGRTCRILKPNDETTQFFAYQLGGGCGLKPGTPYILWVEYPEDVSRSFFIHNGGCETVSGLATGQACGDVAVGRYVNHNPESLKYPLSGKMERWAGLFFLHDRFPELQRPRGVGERPRLPEEGFWLQISNAYNQLDPLSAGAAVGKIRLYQVTEPDKLKADVHFPPGNLPRRYIFWREEMADGVIDSAYKSKDGISEQNGATNALNWYRYKIHWGKALGINVFCKDLLEFGHNQGWDAEKYGGNGWVNQPAYTSLWEQLVELCAEEKMPMIPYYEYCGSLGGRSELSLGFQRRAVRMSGNGHYTHIWWSEKGNVDLSDPDTTTDFLKILDCTVKKYDNRVSIPGIWLRQRVSQTPVSFNERNLRDFATEANAGIAVTREELLDQKSAEGRELCEKYYSWWFEKRRGFLEKIAAELRKNGHDERFLLYTADGGEPGCSLRWQEVGNGKKDSWKYKTAVVTDDFETWEKILSENPMYDKRFVKPATLEEVVEANMYGTALTSWQDNWGGWEVNHALPPSDPDGVRDSDSIMFSYTIHRTYSVANCDTMNRFRSGAGLTCVHHYPLNENELNVKGTDGKEVEPTGYFVADVERAGAFCMMPEVRAVAFGDPTRIGALTANSWQRGFPEVVRAFNLAYLSLPALPSELIQKEKYGKEYVRKIKTPHDGTWYAVCSLSWFPTSVRVDFTQTEEGKNLKDTVTGKHIQVKKNAKTGLAYANIPMKPMSLRVFWLK